MGNCSSRLGQSRRSVRKSIIKETHLGHYSIRKGTTVCGEYTRYSVRITHRQLSDAQMKRNNSEINKAFKPYKRNRFIKQNVRYRRNIIIALNKSTCMCIFALQAN